MIENRRFLKYTYICRLSGLIVCICMLFITNSCLGTERNYGNQTTSEFQGVKNTDGKNILELPIDIFPHGKISADEYIVSKGAENKIYIYDIINKSLKEVAKANDSAKFIKAIAGNSNWVVWFENESETENVENKSYKWDLIAQNLKTGEKVIIDRSSFNSNKFKVPAFINYTPAKITISDQDMVVYSKTRPNGDEKILCELIAYDLPSHKVKVIAKTDSVLDELIDNFTIYKNKIVWSKYRKLDQTYKKRLTQYQYSDLFIFDNVSGNYEQITKNDFLDNPVLYETNLAAIKVPEKENNKNVCTSDVILINLLDKGIKNVINEKTVSSFTSDSSSLYYITLAINDTYLSWKPIGGGDNRFIYDYKNDKFLEVINKNIDNQGFYKQIYDVYGNDIFVHDIQGDDDKNKNYLIKLQ